MSSCLHSSLQGPQVLRPSMVGEVGMHQGETQETRELACNTVMCGDTASPKYIRQPAGSINSRASCAALGTFGPSDSKDLPGSRSQA